MEQYIVVLSLAIPSVYLTTGLQDKKKTSVIRNGTSRVVQFPASITDCPRQRNMCALTLELKEFSGLLRRVSW